ncbi:hypothetical protein Q4543_00690 [Salipiger sp. 1_MG-2023]|nr:hypothetical protein [Salipiger sp. 1_MG-2023]
MERLTIASWNLHRGRGRDGQVDPGRIHAALETGLLPHRPDIVALQEADDESPGRRGFWMRRLNGHEWGAHSHGFQGNVLLLSPGVRIAHAQALDLPVLPRLAFRPGATSG